MHALSRIHKCLKPDGVLLDVHPQPLNSQIEIWQDGRIHHLGEVDQHEDHLEIEAARAHLWSFEQGGLFVTEQQGILSCSNITRRSRAGRTAGQKTVTD